VQKYQNVAAAAATANDDAITIVSGLLEAVVKVYSTFDDRYLATGSTLTTTTITTTTTMTTTTTTTTTTTYHRSLRFADRSVGIFNVSRS